VLGPDIAWTRVIQEVATVIPSDVWLTSFSGTRGSPDKVTFSGRGFDHTSTARWLFRVGELPTFSDLWVANSTKSGVGSLTTVTFASDANLTQAARSDRAKRFSSEAG
jgi:Tfp pilus assembly protein PilN